MTVGTSGEFEMTKFSRAALGAATIALCMSSVAPAASSACWTQADVAAAKVRQMQTKLMVAALRCHAGGVDILASYNRFMRNKKTEITAANNRLKAHFRAAHPSTGERDYDRYTTALANYYGGARTNENSCAEAENMALTAASSRGDLVAVADHQIGSAKMASGRCGREPELASAE
jgi:hypothetical protein